MAGVCFGFVMVVLMAVGPLETMQEADDYPDYPMGGRYDEYPVVVPKRAALLLDRLMVALKNAMEEEEDGTAGVGSNSAGGRASPKTRSLPVTSQEDTMGMQRRGHGSIGGQHKGRVYWRCYFNAVTCFRRK